VGAWYPRRLVEGVYQVNERYLKEQVEVAFARAGCTAAVARTVISVVIVEVDDTLKPAWLHDLPSA
jgi:hypothetical protein